MGDKLTEQEAAQELSERLHPNTVRWESSGSAVGVTIHSPTGELIFANYGIELDHGKVDEEDLRVHANNLREKAGMPDLPSDEAGRGFCRTREPR